MTKVFLLLWLLGSAGDTGHGWLEADQVRPIGPFPDMASCQKLERQIQAWRSPIYAKCAPLGDVPTE